ncbi:TenA family transcriptional regulator [Variovorax sp. PAMC26660]|uniref:TenA family transcriptional regulator n=1 Tax=Variovorax sp. PAMC26660 TaxID=2762322 RepID=UPI0021C3DBFE|nr:iron-containing redox enzyme family protein [Variovorax sp. PAMC26660]
MEAYQVTKHFISYIEHLYFYCPLPRHKRFLLTNLYEEETGRLSRTKNHIELMADFIEALGVPDSVRDAVKPMKSTLDLIRYRLDAVKDPSNYHIGAAAVMIASEGQNLENEAHEARDSLFGRTYGLTEQDLRFFSVHRKEDVGHVQQGLNLVSEYCTTKKMQDEALFAVHHTSRLFYQMYEGMYQAFVVSPKAEELLIKC